MNNKYLKIYKICEGRYLNLLKCYLVNIRFMCYNCLIFIASEYNYLVILGTNVRAGYDKAFKITSTNVYLETVKYLVTMGVDIRVDDYFAVRWVSKNGHLEIVKYLVSQCANIRAANDYVIRLASKNGHMENVEYLVTLGADIRLCIVSQSVDIHVNDDLLLQNITDKRYVEIIKFSFPRCHYSCK